MKQVSDGDDDDDEVAEFLDTRYAGLL